MQTPLGRPLWDDTLPSTERWEGRPLPNSCDVDVVIIGGGFTGLWTAVHLAQRRPDARIVVFEAERVGFGASGRNGGWCSALLPMGLDAIAERHGTAAAARMQAAMNSNVADVVAFAARAGIADACHHGGTISIARNTPQRERLLANIATMQRFGFDELEWLDRSTVAEHCRVAGAIGGVFTPHCATVHPQRLLHAVARAASATGVAIHESTRVERIEDRAVHTAHGTVRADVVVRAVEGYTPTMPGMRRELLPIYSLMIATEPLPPAVLSEIGLDGRPTFNDARNLIVYGQRTTDGRIAFGGRGAPYHFGSAVRPEFDSNDGVRELLRQSLGGLFPALRDVAITHHWGGPLGAARDWHCAVRFDRTTGAATAGGYVGDGVATTHLAGRTLAALISGSDDDADRELVALPWVGHRSRRWEPEPLRWLGVNAVRRAAGRADAVERRHDRASAVWGGIVRTFTGH